MALAALISAVREAREPGVALRATFWLAGRTLIERQARLAAEAGAGLIVILVESLPGELVQSIERLRKEGLEIVTARNAAEAAAAIPSGFRLMLIADGFVGASVHVERLMGAERPALLAVTDRGFDERFERIDGVSRWAGLALIDADLLRDAALMPSEWDLQSTLLRRALQTGVKPLPLSDEREAAELAVVERSQDFAELQRRILVSAESAPKNWLSGLLLQPVERWITGALLETSATPLMVGSVSAGLSALAALLFAFDWRWFGLLALFLLLPLEGVAVRLGRLRLQPVGAAAWWRLLRPVLLAAALLALGQRLSITHGWGMLLIAGAIAAFAIALRQEMQGKRVAGGALLADAPSLALILLVCAPFGLWATALAVMLGYAAISFFWAQFQVHRGAGLAHG